MQPRPPPRSTYSEAERLREEGEQREQRGRRDRWHASQKTENVTALLGVEKRVAYLECVLLCSHPSRNSFSVVPPLRVRVFRPRRLFAENGRVPGTDSCVQTKLDREGCYERKHRFSMVMADAVRSVDTRRKPASRRGFEVLFAASARQPTRATSRSLPGGPPNRPRGSMPHASTLRLCAYSIAYRQTPPVLVRSITSPAVQLTLWSEPSGALSSKSSNMRS